MYGHLTPEMEQILLPHIRDQEVWDLGAGDLGWVRWLADNGASKVIAVDKEDYYGPLPTKVQYLHSCFDKVVIPATGIPVAFLAWPQNGLPRPNQGTWGLDKLIWDAGKIIYLGCNTGGSSCGNPFIFCQFVLRDVLAHVPHRRNTLLIYGDRGAEPRLLHGEEYAAVQGEELQFEDVQGRQFPIPGEPEEVEKCR